MIKRELNLFFNALLFYTRIRVPSSVVCNPQTLNDALRYFPLVGILVSALSAAVYVALASILPREVAVLGLMAASILLTGALHEDGVADCFDAFGAGYDKETILRIMKDSTIGTYGAIGLILTLGLRYQMLMLAPESVFLPMLLAAATLSRFYPVLVVRFSHYARTEQSKSQHVTLGLSHTTLFLAALISLPFAFCFGWPAAILILVLESLLCLVFCAYTHKWIGGYTGDCLGAMQQFLELLFYAIVLALPSFYSCL